MSAELYLDRGNLVESALSRLLLGLFLAEETPALALPALEAAASELDDGVWLTYGYLAQALCLARVGRPEEARRLLQERWWRDQLRHPYLVIHAQWLEVRIGLALSSSGAVAELARLASRFLDNALYHEAALVLLDLHAAQAEGAFMEELYGDFLRDLPAAGHGSELLSAATLLASGSPGADAALRRQVSTLSRYPFESIARLAAPHALPLQFHVLIGQVVADLEQQQASSAQAAALKLSASSEGRVLARILRQSPGSRDDLFEDPFLPRSPGKPAE